MPGTLPAGRWKLVAILFAVCLAGCQGGAAPQPGTTVPQAPPPVSGEVPVLVDGPPEFVPPDLGRLPDPVPVAEPKSRTGNPPSYAVFGKTYHTLETAAGYEATGRASWYGRKFQWRRTSSGEPFDTLKLTAAHPTLPIPSYVEVTNLDNGLRIVVRVNDRGPFHEGRIIDLSYAAAVKLGFADVGTAPVRVVALNDLPALYLQAGAFQEIDAANRLRGELERLTGKPARVVRIEEEPPFRVRLGPLNGEREAQRLQALIATADHGVPEYYYGEPVEQTH